MRKRFRKFFCKVWEGFGKVWVMTRFFGKVSASWQRVGLVVFARFWLWRSVSKVLGKVVGKVSGQGFGRFWQGFRKVWAMIL